MRCFRVSLLLVRWFAVAALAIPLAGYGKDKNDLLIMRTGAKLQGALAGCDAKSCTLDGKPYLRQAIDWIGLAVGDAAPPKVDHPETDEEHLHDGSVRSAQLLSIDAGTVLVASGSLPRDQVAFIHMARPPAASVPPNQTDQPKSSTRVLHFSVRVEASASYFDEGNIGFSTHYLHDSKIAWIGVWPDVVVEVDEATGRIGIFHLKGTPRPPAGETAAGEITASLTYHMIFDSPVAGRAQAHDCSGSLTDRVYPARLKIDGVTKIAESSFYVGAWPPSPAGDNDPELRGQQLQEPDRDCQIAAPRWPAWRVFRIPIDLEFKVQATQLGLYVFREKGSELFFPLDAILADHSFALDTGRQRQEMTSPGRKSLSEWRAKIEFTALGADGGAPGGSPDD